jgi:DNA-binding Xre family transcriptional regulator
MSLKIVAEKAGIPISTLEKIYYPQKSETTITIVAKIAKALNVKIDDLIR